MKLNIEYKATGGLVPYEKNARIHSDYQVGQIIASIKEFGFNNPILLDGENGVVAGHGRLLAAKKMGLKEVPCIELSHLSDEKKRAYIVADNKIITNAGWDNELLRKELQDLADLDISSDAMGFSTQEVDAMLDELKTVSIVSQMPQPPAPSANSDYQPQSQAYSGQSAGRQTYSPPSDYVPQEYAPNVEPELSNDQVDSGDLEKAQNRLDNQYAQTKKLETVMCPSCGEEFYLDKKAI